MDVDSLQPETLIDPCIHRDGGWDIMIMAH